MDKTTKVPVLRFPEFSGEWEVKVLGDLTLEHKGGAPLQPKDFVKNSTYEVIPKKAIQGGGKLQLDNITPIFCTEIFFNSYNNSVVNNDFIITTLRDLVPSAPSIGYMVKIKTRQSYIMAQGVYGLKVDKKKISEDFLIKFSNTYDYRKVMKTIKVGSTQVHIRITDFFKIKISIPLISEQQKIANFLSLADRKIEQLTQKKQLIERYKKAMMQKVFSQQLRFKDHQGNDYPDWEIKALGDFLIPEFRGVDKPTELYLAIGIRSHCKGTFHKPNTDPKKNAMDTLFLVKENDFIVNITFAWEGAIAIVAKEDNNGLVSHRFPTYIFNTKITTSTFFKYIFIQPWFRFKLDLISPGGAGRNRVLSKKELLKVTCNFPSINEQTKIARYLTHIDQKIQLVDTQLKQAQQFKQGLLQKMFV